MRQLTVHIQGNIEDDRVLATLFDVVAADGSLLAQGIASPRHPARVRLPDSAAKRVHIIGYSPSGRRSQETLKVGKKPLEAHLNVAESPHEWLQWVAPFRSLNHLSEDASAGPHAQPRKIGRVWMTLWQLQDGQWSSRSAVRSPALHDEGMRQISIAVPNVPTLLQVGGEEVSWRLISLPPGGLVRVAVTRSPIDDPDVDSVEVTVGRVRPMDELIMSYLSRGATVEAARLGAAWKSADRALYAKGRDPISAAAGAYLLLKIGRLGERRAWVENLVNRFPNFPDGAIVAAALALQQDKKDKKAVRKYLDLAVDRGVPVFSLGMSILVETMAAVHRGSRETKRFKAAYQQARAYHQAQASRGAYFAFYGKSPALPSWLRYKGPPDAPAPDQNDVARSNLGPTANVRLDIDAFGDSRQVQIGHLDLSELAGDQHLRSRADSTASAAETVRIDAVLQSVRVTPALKPKPRKGSWMEQRQEDAFDVFGGAE